MLALYRIYQLLVMLPLMAAVTIVAAVITATGSIAFGGRWWGYYPAKIRGGDSVGRVVHIYMSGAFAGPSHQRDLLKAAFHHITRTDMRKWRIEDSAELYNITGWGLKYFSINDKGHVSL